MTAPAYPLGAAVACALVVLSGAAHAQETCHSAGRYMVLEIEYPETVGNRFAVRVNAADGRTCDFDAASADFLVGEDNDPLWFEAITPRYFVMTRSTGPHGDVIFYDLDTRSVRHEAPADEVEVTDGMAIYWERMAEGTAATCPEFAEYKSDGLGAVIAAETRFDFATGRSQATGRTRCDATQ